MKFYKATSFIFPHHYERRIMLVCFLAVHVPLATAVGYQALTGTWDAATLLVLLAATLAGTALGIAAVHALLSPISHATRMLSSIQEGQRIVRVPSGSSDIVGQLLNGVAHAANESAGRMETLIAAAERDPLTGIRNRRGFLDTAERLLNGYGNAVVALIDLDHFKLVNDKFGHSVGDNLLVAVAAQLETNLRRSDVAGRWGGEEFIVLLPDTHLDEAQMVMERLRANFALNSNLLEDSWPVTFSCGLAPLRDFSELWGATRKADAALYDAKESGRNRVRVAAH